MHTDELTREILQRFVRTDNLPVNGGARRSRWAPEADHQRLAGILRSPDRERKILADPTGDAATASAALGVEMAEKRDEGEGEENRGVALAHGAHHGGSRGP